MADDGEDVTSDLDTVAADLTRHGISRLAAAVLAADLAATPVGKRWTLWGHVYGRTRMKAAAVGPWLITHGYAPEKAEDR